MAIFSIFNKLDKDSEDKIYEFISIEIEEGRMIRSTWTKALAESSKKKDRVESLYIKLRFDELSEYLRKFKLRETSKHLPLDVFAQTEKEYHKNTSQKTKNRTTWIGEGKLFFEILSSGSPYMEKDEKDAEKTLNYDLKKGLISKNS